MGNAALCDTENPLRNILAPSMDIRWAQNF